MQCKQVTLSPEACSRSRGHVAKGSKVLASTAAPTRPARHTAYTPPVLEVGGGWNWSSLPPCSHSQDLIQHIRHCTFHQQVEQLLQSYPHLVNPSVIASVDAYILQAARSCRQDQRKHQVVSPLHQLQLSHFLRRVTNLVERRLDGCSSEEVIALYLQSNATLYNNTIPRGNNNPKSNTINSTPWGNKNTTLRGNRRVSGRRPGSLRQKVGPLVLEEPAKVRVRQDALGVRQDESAADLSRAAGRRQSRESDGDSNVVSCKGRNRIDLWTGSSASSPRDVLTQAPIVNVLQPQVSREKEMFTLKSTLAHEAVSTDEDLLDRGDPTRSPTLTASSVWRQKLLSHLVSSVSILTEEELCQLVTGLHRHYQGDEFSLLSALEQHVNTHLQTLSPSTLLALVNCFLDTQYQPASDFVTAAVEYLTQHMQDYQHNSELFHSTVQGLCNLPFSSVLNYSATTHTVQLHTHSEDTPTLTHHSSTEAERRAANMLARGSAINTPPCASPRSYVLSSLLSHCQNNLWLYSCSQLRVLLHCLVRAEVQLPASFLADAYSLLTSHMAQLSNTDLSSVLWLLAKLHGSTNTHRIVYEMSHPVTHHTCDDPSPQPSAQHHTSHATPETGVATDYASRINPTTDHIRMTSAASKQSTTAPLSHCGTTTIHTVANQSNAVYAVHQQSMENTCIRPKHPREPMWLSGRADTSNQSDQDARVWEHTTQHKVERHECQGCAMEHTSRGSTAGTVLSSRSSESKSTLLSGRAGLLHNLSSSTAGTVASSPSFRSGQGALLHNPSSSTAGTATSSRSPGSGRHVVRHTASSSAGGTVTPSHSSGAGHGAVSHKSSRSSVTNTAGALTSSLSPGSGSHVGDPVHRSPVHPSASSTAEMLSDTTATDVFSTQRQRLKTELHALLSSVITCTASHLHEFSPQQLACSLWALGKLRTVGIRPTARWLQAACSAVRLSHSACGPLELSNIIWAFAKLDYTPPLSVMKVLVGATRSHLSNCNPQQLSNIAFSLHRLQAPVCDTWKWHFISASAARLPEFSAQQLANTVVALAGLGVCPDAAWVSRFEACVLRQADSFKPIELGHLVQGMWSLGLTPCSRVLAALMHRTHAQIDYFKPHTLSVVLWVLQQWPQPDGAVKLLWGRGKRARYKSLEREPRPAIHLVWSGNSVHGAAPGAEAQGFDPVDKLISHT